MSHPEPSNGSTARTVAIRLLTAADVPFAAELNAIVGWNQTEKDWRGYLEFEPQGCFVAETEGQRAGTATTIAYGDRFGWIGMVLVRPECRRFGIGTRLLRHTIEYLQRRGTGCVKLDATPMGRKVYVPLGFVDEYDLSRYEGTAPVGASASAEGIEPFTAAATADVAAFDAPIFGSDRRAVLESMRARDPQYCFVARANGRIRGYAIARDGRQAVQLGPWLADDARVAEQLLVAVFRQVPGRRLFVDVPHPNPAGRALIEKHGFNVQRGFARMYLGENRFPGIPQHVFGTSGAEKG